MIYQQPTLTEQAALAKPCPICNEPLKAGDTLYGAVHNDTGEYREIHGRCLYPPTP